MKKNLLYVLAILVSTAMWSSCSDDDNGGDNEGPLTAPEVSMQNLSLKNTVLREETVRLRANIINTTEADLQWFMDGKEVSKDTIFEFSSAQEGTFKIKVTASNVIGAASDSVNIQVKDGFGISSIKNWTGNGENQSVLAIQWIAQDVEDLLHPEDKDVFFRAWGYKWEKKSEQPTGYDMIAAIAKKDARLFVIVAQEGSHGVTIKGFGYDGNGDGKIEIKSQDTETFKELHLTQGDFIDGIYKQVNEEDNIDGFEVISEGDYWIGGWYEAYASYWLGSGEAVLDGDEYEYSPFTVANRVLEDKSWDAWTFSPINNEMVNIQPIPRLLRAAENK